MSPARATIEIQRVYRRKRFATPKTASSLRTIEIPDELRKTLRGVDPSMSPQWSSLGLSLCNRPTHARQCSAATRTPAWPRTCGCPSRALPRLAPPFASILL